MGKTTGNGYGLKAAFYTTALMTVVAATPMSAQGAVPAATPTPAPVTVSDCMSGNGDRFACFFAGAGDKPMVEKHTPNPIAGAWGWLVPVGIAAGVGLALDFMNRLGNGRD
jgi:hypothetical protein